MSEAIPCPKCSHGESKVKDSRPITNLIRRRRICTACKFRFNTYEVAGDFPPADLARMANRMMKAHEAAEKLFALAEDVKVLTR